MSHFLHFTNTLTMNSTVVILEVCRTPVTHESANELAVHEFFSSCSSVDMVLLGVWEVMGLISLEDSDFFFVPLSRSQCRRRVA